MVTSLTDLGINWSSQTGGVIIGACFGCLFSTLGVLVIQVFREARPKQRLGPDAGAAPDLAGLGLSSLNERLYYQRETLQVQFEQDLAGRRVEALADLQQLLDEQFHALASLWSCCRKDKMKVLSNLGCDERLDTLVEKQYLRKAWAADKPLRRDLNNYTNACDELTAELLYNQAMNHEPFFKSAAAELGPVMHELPKLMFRLNDIEIADSMDPGDTISRLTVERLREVEA